MFLFTEKYRWVWHIAFWLTYILVLSYTFGQIMPFWSAQTRVFLGLILHAAFAYFNWYWLIPQFFLNRKYLHYFSISILSFFGLAVLRFWIEQLLPTYIVSTVTTILPLRLIFIAFSFLSIWVLSSLFRLLEDRIKTMQLENELRNAQLNSELRFLKSQINPHFLFNTLNNVYSLAYLKSDLAAPMILKLSGMLRYMLYECDAPKVGMQKEIEYLQDYVELQVLNPTDRPKVTFEVINHAPQLQIEPMLFVNFIENAFKHGNLNHPKGFIKIYLKIEPQRLLFEVQNSVGSSHSKDKVGGLGLQNVRQRLSLLYAERHRLEISRSTTLFQISLQLKF